MLKPICFLDLETTGTDIAKDRIVNIALKKFSSIGGFCEDEFYTLVNPGIPIPPEATECHGITDEMVAKMGDFKFYSSTVLDVLNGCDLGGFNLIAFDVPLLWEELHRAGHKLDLEGVNIIDAGNIFKKKEERTLTAAMKFYCGKSHEGAHNASDDVDATAAVLEAQLARYPELSAMTHAELYQFCKWEENVDLAGKIIRNDKGEPVYAFGKHEGKCVKDEPSYARWMLDADFPEQTKMVLRGLLQ